MQKKSLILFSLIGLMLISFVSAYNGYSGTFSLGDFFNEVDSSTIVLILVFFILFGFINFSLSKVFKDKYGEPNKATAGIVALAISILAIYGFHKWSYTSSFNFENILFEIGLPPDMTYPILFLVLIAGFFFFGDRYGHGNVLMVIGGLLAIISFTDFVYEKGVLLILGIILFIIGIFVKKRVNVTDPLSRGASALGRGAGALGGGLGKGALEGAKWGVGKTKEKITNYQEKMQERRKADMAQKQNMEDLIKQQKTQKEAIRKQEKQMKKEMKRGGAPQAGMIGYSGRSPKQIGMTVKDPKRLESLMKRKTKIEKYMMKLQPYLAESMMGKPAYEKANKRYQKAIKLRQKIQDEINRLG